MATHSSVLAWRIPGTGEPGGLLSMGSHRVGHDWSDLAAAAAENPFKHLGAFSLYTYIYIYIYNFIYLSISWLWWVLVALQAFLYSFREQGLFPVVGCRLLSLRSRALGSLGFGNCSSHALEHWLKSWGTGWVALQRVWSPRSRKWKGKRSCSVVSDSLRSQGL